MGSWPLSTPGGNWCAGEVRAHGPATRHPRATGRRSHDLPRAEHGADTTQVTPEHACALSQDATGRRSGPLAGAPSGMTRSGKADDDGLPILSKDVGAPAAALRIFTATWTPVETDLSPDVSPGSRA
jgi:hypothetical protein